MTAADIHGFEVQASPEIVQHCGKPAQKHEVRR
jgi:hypothetical protein